SEFSKPAGCDFETPDGMIGLIGKPDVIIRAGGNAHAHPAKGELIFGDHTMGSDGSNPAGRAFTEPDVAVGSRCNECRIAQARGREVADAAARSGAGAFAAVGKREPEVAVLAHGDGERLAALTDGKAFERRRLGGSAACQEGERREPTAKAEIKLMPGEREAGKGGLNGVKTCYHMG